MLDSENELSGPWEIEVPDPVEAGGSPKTVLAPKEPKGDAFCGIPNVVAWLGDGIAGGDPNGKSAC